MGLIKEFKDFAMRGSVIDLAVGVVIGAAFQKIVDSVVKDLLMPVLGLLLNGIDFSHLEIPLMGEAKITIGNFINTTIQFIIMAFAVFLLIKGINRLNRLQEEKDAAAEATAPPAEPNAQEKLLSEIRDLLKNR
ncbi:MAG: large-conductance mechanosensitive channel protein MscL [Bacteroidota bacterium]|jgi:large conductance mechanosensitive channel|nr:large-conductance mechanosensitive channel protein MscL [Sphingobacteriales bacterium]